MTPLWHTLVSTDLEVLESCSLLEALALDDEDVRLSLACRRARWHRSDYHPLWRDLPGDGAQRKHTIDFRNAALIKAVV
jgi:hypothetical protein